MANNENYYKSLRDKLEKVGFIFEGEQKPHFQKRDLEWKFTHPILIKKFKEEGLDARATKFYIKPISDSPRSEIGLVTGKTSPLKSHFNNPNEIDTFNEAPAWVNREKDESLNILLKKIGQYLKNS